ncbi:hypothetical protein NQ317_001804 [Molorchus minor]|uniref:Polycystin cation channel PKD1/PKD2 domain-containing protein n=1 Tax=Molorchus minor TaxID=1323400 RepID=A0ABQ9JU59_9CUCU|nr:hypothetical protein NQ317_001804 [Molorchus minor]
MLQIDIRIPNNRGVLPSAEIHSVTLTRKNDAFNTLIECCEYGLLVFLIFYLIEGLREIFFLKFSYLKKFWSYIDWSILGCLIAQMVFVIRRKIEIDPALETIANNPNKYANLEEFAHMKRQRNNIFVVSLFFVYVKIFKFLNFNRTMGQLNNTLRKCALDILGFSLMFFIIYFAFGKLVTCYLEVR